MAKRITKKSSRRAAAKQETPERGSHLPQRNACIDLDSVIGHARPKQTLRAAAASGRVHHAWIFSGPTGVGKRTTAEAFAATLLAADASADTEPETDLLGNPIAPAGGLDSEVLTLLKRRAHPDYHHIAKELASYSSEDATRRSKQRSIPINVIREFLIEPAYKAATLRDEHTDSGIRKVFLIDEAELLRAGDNAAQNALLKTLEEPPEGTLIILVTAREDALLPTIRSRCQRVCFGRLTDEEMETWLNLQAERFSALAQQDRDTLKRFADGSPGLFEIGESTGISEWASVLQPDLDALDRGQHTGALASNMKQLCSEWSETWVKARPLASKESANHAAVDHMLRLLTSRYSDQLRVASARSAIGDRDAIETETYRPLAMLDAIAQAGEHARRNVNLDFVFSLLGFTETVRARA